MWRNKPNKMLYVVCAVVVLLGCIDYFMDLSESSKTKTNTDPSESSTPYVTPETSETSADTSVTTEETALQLPAATYTDDLPIIRIERNDPEINEDVITVEGEGFTDLSDSLDEIQSSNSELYDELHDLDYSCSNKYYLERCDSELVSFYYNARYSNSDQVFEGYTFTCDGDTVFFEDLIIPGQEEAFTEAVEGFIDDEYSDALENEFYDELDINDVYSQFENIENTQWFLDVSSIVFIYRYHLGDSQNDRACAIHIPYSEFEEYIDPAFLPGDKAMIGTYSNYDFYYSDDLKLSTDLQGYDELRDHILDRNFKCLYINGHIYVFNNAYLADTGVCTYVRDEDGNSYLVIVQAPTNEFVEGMEYVKVYDITEGELDLVYSSDEGYDKRYYSNIPEVLSLVESGITEG